MNIYRRSISPTLQLVDPKGKGVDRVTENAVVVEGIEYAVDCVIFATGFEVQANRERSGLS